MKVETSLITDQISTAARYHKQVGTLRSTSKYELIYLDRSESFRYLFGVAVRFDRNAQVDIKI